jgi:nitrous oxidase accessory protein NosD
MSYTLRGRLETRLAALAAPLLAACAWAALAHAWWPLELAALMALVGLALDAEVYHRLLPYQPGWLALPLGALELALVMGLARALDVRAPLLPAVAFFAAAWLVAQALGHAALPLLHLTYAQDGGELGRAGPLLALTVLSALAGAGGAAWAAQPPTVRLGAGMHVGPLVIRRPERLVGEPGAVVRGGIVIRSDGVTVRDVSVVGGDYGFDVDGARGVRLEHVAVSRARLDGIHVRRSSIAIRDCTVDSTGNPWAQGIDISYTFDRAPSRVEGCTVVGGREGIVTHFAQAMLAGNRVSGTSFHGIGMTEMSMGDVMENEVHDARGVGIYCGDHSTCMVERNVVADTRPDGSGDRTLAGFGILAHYGAEADLAHNELVGNGARTGAILDSTIRHR